MTDACRLLFSRARRVIPGGVNSPVRAFKAVGGEPVFMQRGQGSRLFAADGREFIDFCGSWGPLILGHAHPAVVEAIRTAAGDGSSFGTCTEREVELAELLCSTVPYLEKARLVNSGTEACMTAVRLARAVTGRAKILKFDGGYHGHADAFLVAAGSGLLAAGTACSAGVPPHVVADTLVAPYNDADAVAALLRRHGPDVAAVIVEPVAGNMGLVPPVPGFLEALLGLSHKAGALLIFDEVITGFRLGPTTYGMLCGPEPDLTCLGKIIGGGMPLAAVGGRKEIMDRLAPLGPVYQAGTLSGNPLAVAAGLATLNVLMAQNPYPAMNSMGAKLSEGIAASAQSRNCRLICERLGSMFSIFFGRTKVRNLVDARKCKANAFPRYFHGMLERGIYLPPSPFETCFISAAHAPEDIDRMVKAFDEVVSETAQILEDG